MRNYLHLRRGPEKKFDCVQEYATPKICMPQKCGMPRRVAVCANGRIRGLRVCGVGDLAVRCSELCFSANCGSVVGTFWLLAVVALVGRLLGCCRLLQPVAATRT